MVAKKLLTALFLLVFTFLLVQAQKVVYMSKNGNVYELQGKLNGVPMKFILDTGASDVCISLSEAVFLLKNNYLTEDDIIGSTYASLANGEIVQKTKIMIKEMEIGGVKIYNVTASISHTLNAPLLLGQSAIQKLGKITLEGNKLIIHGANPVKNDNKAYEYFQKGFQEIEKEDYKSAIKTLKNALLYASNAELRSEIYGNLSMAYKGDGDYENAIASCHWGLGENLMNVTCGYNLGVYYFETNDYVRAEKAFKRFLWHREMNMQSPKSEIEKFPIAAAYEYLGAIYYEWKKFILAKDYYNRSIVISPEHSIAYLGLAKLYIEEGDVDNAIKYFEYGIEYNGERLTNINYIFELIKLYYSKKNYNQVIKKCEYSKYLFNKYESYLFWSLNPEYGDDETRQNYHGFILNYIYSCELLVLAHIALSDNSSHKQLVDKVIEIIEPLVTNFTAFLCTPSLWQNYALAKSEKESNPQLYESILEEAYKFNQTDFDFIYLYLNAIAASGNFEKYKGVIEKSLNLLPDNINLMYLYTTTMNDSTKVIEQYVKIIELKGQQELLVSDWGTVYNNLAWAYHLSNQDEKGLPLARKSVAINPEHSYSWETLGEIYYAIEDYSNCIQAMNKCIELNEYLKIANEFIGKSYIKLGNTEKGNNYLQKAADILE